MNSVMKSIIKLTEEKDKDKTINLNRTNFRVDELSSAENTLCFCRHFRTCGSIIKT